jgi:tRNA-splicing ligase RtcB
MKTEINTYRHNNIHLTIGGTVPVKEWTVGVNVEEDARQQLVETANLPFIFKHIVALPDVHYGKGSTVGSVIPTIGAVIPAAVGVDLGCGLYAAKTTLKKSHLPNDLSVIRSIIESYIPNGRTDNGGMSDKGAWQDPPVKVKIAWKVLDTGYKQIISKYKDIAPHTDPIRHLGTLGSNNHFFEVTIDENDSVWLMLHSGSRGVGNRIGSYFTNLAKREMKQWYIDLSNIDLAYLPENSEHFNNYMFAVEWAQNFAAENREQMMNQAVEALHHCNSIPKFELTDEQVRCHHNYIAKEYHFGKKVYVTRKGAISAKKGQLGVTPGSMGAKSFIVCGLGNEESFTSAAHGAGRQMSRTKAKATFSIEDHILATAGIECRKDANVIDETPGSYKDIDDVMAAQSDLVSVVHTLKQVLCIKG